MKTVLAITLALGALIAAPFASAHAAQLAPPVARQLYTCDRGGLSRVAMSGQPAPCCTGLLGCPQLLANTGLVKPKRDNRT